MADLLDDPIFASGFGLLVLAILGTVAFYGVSRFRDYAAQDQEDPSDLLAKLQEMHLRGDITDEEFRTIQASAHPLHDDAADESDSTSIDEESASLHKNHPVELSRFAHDDSTPKHS